jgi:putrescine transport system ATP-binding protein
MLLVSHSREEASALADRAGLIIGGRLAQEGTVAEIFARPETAEAALYSGVENIIRGVIDEASGGRIVVMAGGPPLRIAVTGQGVPGQAVTCGIRARDIRLYRVRPEAAEGNIVTGTVTGSYRTGDRTVVMISGDTDLRAEVPGDREFRAGSTVHAAFDPGDVLVYME